MPPKIQDPLNTTNITGTSHQYTFFIISHLGGKQWQTTPKNLLRMQSTRVIPVAWLRSGLCPNRPKGWIPIIIIISPNSSQNDKYFRQNCGENHNTRFTFNNIFPEAVPFMK